MPACSTRRPITTKYDSMQAMMREEMMKRMGGGMGMPPH